MCICYYIIDLDKPNSRKTLVTGSIPTENLPLRPHESTKTPRRTIVRKEVEGDISSTSSTVFCLGDLVNQLDTTALSPWLTEIVEDEYIKCCLSDQVHAVPTYTVIVDPSLGFTTYVYNWPIPDGHGLYSNYKRSLKSAEDLQELLSTIETSTICKGVDEDCESTLQLLTQMQTSQLLVHKH